MASVRGKRVIYVGPADSANNKPLHIEALSDEDILPGSVLEFDTIAGVTTISLSSVSATVFGQMLFVADKKSFNASPIDAPWLEGESVIAIQPRSGEFINILLGPGAVLEVGTPLARSGGVGELQVALDTGTEEIVGFSDESVTTINTQLVRVRIT